MEREPSDSLSVALTRPPLWMGVPYYYAIALICFSFFAWMWLNAGGVQMLTTVFIIVPIDLIVWFIGWDLTRSDPRFFSVLTVFLSSVPSQIGSRKFWGGRSYETR